MDNFVTNILKTITAVKCVCILGQFYLFIFRTPTLCLVGGNENVGGDEERSILGRRNHIVRFVPHSVEPVEECSVLVGHKYTRPFCSQETHIGFNAQFCVVLNAFKLIFIVQLIFFRRKGFKPIAALFHTRCCPLHLHRTYKMFQTDKKANRLGDGETNRQTEEEKTKNQTNGKKTGLKIFSYLCNHT